MRIFVLGTGASGALLAQLLARQGHRVTCGDKDPERAKRFLGRKSTLPVVTVNARNLRGVVRAARGCQLLVNASPAVFNEVALRAALRLRAHYLDLAAHLTRNPFKAEQLAYDERFAEKRRAAVINAGVAPGLTNLLAARAADLLDEVESIYIRLYEGSEAMTRSRSGPPRARSMKPSRARAWCATAVFGWPSASANASASAFRPRLAKSTWFWRPRTKSARYRTTSACARWTSNSAGNEIDRLRRWYRQGKLRRSRGLVTSRFPHTPTPRQVARLIRRGVLQNARFAAAVIVRGRRGEQTLEIRWDASFPTLYQIRQRGLAVTPVSYATAHMAALFSCSIFRARPTESSRPMRCRRRRAKPSSSVLASDSASPCARSA